VPNRWVVGHVSILPNCDENLLHHMLESLKTNDSMLNSCPLAGNISFGILFLTVTDDSLHFGHRHPERYISITP
jgi:hypothetical protein